MDRSDISILVIDHGYGKVNFDPKLDSVLDNEVAALRVEGYNVKWVGSFRDDNPESYDLILAHPNWGFESHLLIKLRETHPHIPIIVNSGIYMHDIGEKFPENCPALDYFQDSYGVYTSRYSSLSNMIKLVNKLAEDVLDIKFEDLDPSEWNNSRKEPQLSFEDDLIKIYTAFRDQVHNPESVLYPSCGFDASPSRVFDNVTFVDIEEGNKGCVAKLQEAGLYALKQDIRNYAPKALHDLLILLNPVIPTEWASRHLKSGGYVLSNNYHRNASEMHQKPDQFTLWGVVNLIDNAVEISRDVTDFLVPVESEEELKRLRPDEHEFLSQNYPSMLRNMNVKPKKKFEDMYVQFKRLGGGSEQLPAKRVADRYIFVKK